MSELWKSVTMADRQAAQRTAYALGVPDVQGERQLEIIAREFARFRLALSTPSTLAEIATLSPSPRPDEREIAP